MKKFFSFPSKAKKQAEENISGIDNFSKTPSDVLLLVFNYLLVVDLIKASRVSKKFREVVNNHSIWLRVVSEITKNKIISDSKIINKASEAKRKYVTSKQFINKKKNSFFNSTPIEIFEQAISSNHYEAVYQLLIDKEIDHVTSMVHSENRNFTILSFAAHKGNYEIVKLLLEFGANVNLLNKYLKINATLGYVSASEQQDSALDLAKKPEIKALLYLAAMEKALTSEKLDEAKKYFQLSYQNDKTITKEYVGVANKNQKGFYENLSSEAIKAINDCQKEFDKGMEENFLSRSTIASKV